MKIILGISSMDADQNSGPSQQQWF